MTERHARHLRSLIERAAEGYTDNNALGAVEMYPTYEMLVSKTASVAQGTRFRYADKLYKTLQPTTVFDGTYAPGTGTESLYAEVHEQGQGTFDNPIAYDNNMELESGLYYMQDSVKYICFRSTGQPVYSPLSALVGLYVNIA